MTTCVYGFESIHEFFGQQESGILAPQSLALYTPQHLNCSIMQGKGKQNLVKHLDLCRTGEASLVLLTVFWTISQSELFLAFSKPPLRSFVTIWSIWDKRSRVCVEFSVMPSWAKCVCQSYLCFINEHQACSSQLQQHQQEDHQEELETQIVAV